MALPETHILQRAGMRLAEGLVSVEDFHWHDLRHTCASRLVMAGVDLNRIREILGHAGITMTLRYAHLAPDQLKAAIRVLDAQPAPMVLEIS